MPRLPFAWGLSVSRGITESVWGGQSEQPSPSHVGSEQYVCDSAPVAQLDRASDF